MNLKSFDYIIVGAGSAGCVLANRLSENPAIKVALIEAGGLDRHFFVQTPAAFSKLFKTKRDWAFETTPQTGLNNQRMFSPRGKMLGGCSSMNAMIYTRPHPLDMEAWCKFGVQGFEWESCLPYLIRAEQQMGFFHDDIGAYSNEPMYIHPLTEQFVQATHEFGWPINKSSSSIQKGSQFFLKNIRNGKRFSVVDAYLQPIADRKNLNIINHSQVSKLLLNKNEVTGIEFFQKNKLQQLHCNREIILCAGAFQSPQLLMLSGIGNSLELETHGIQTILDLKTVGKHLKDHLICGMAFRLKKGIQSLDSLNQLVPAVTSLVQYLRNKTGPLCSNIAEAGSFINTKGNSDRPDLEFHFGPAFFIQHGFIQPKPHGISFGPTLLHPKSQGAVQLQSNNPLDAPVINPNYYQDESDLELMVEGLKITREISKQKVWEQIIDALEFPAYEARSDDDYIKHLRQYSQTLYHPTGTCRMSALEDGVVDSEFKVKGVANLRIADASVIPTTISSNTQATVLMLAEKLAAQMI